MAEKKTKQKKGKGRKGAPISAAARALGLKIRKARENKKLSQTKAGECLGISRQGFQHYEKGKSLPPASDLPKLCELLSMDIREFGGAQDSTASMPATTDEMLLQLHGLWALLEVPDRAAVIDFAEGRLALKRQRELLTQQSETLIGNENQNGS